MAEAVTLHAVVRRQPPRLISPYATEGAHIGVWLETTVVAFVQIAPGPLPQSDSENGQRVGPARAQLQDNPGRVDVSWWGRGSGGDACDGVHISAASAKRSRAVAPAAQGRFRLGAEYRGREIDGKPTVGASLDADRAGEGAQGAASGLESNKNRFSGWVRTREGIGLRLNDG